MGLNLSGVQKSIRYNVGAINGTVLYFRYLFKAQCHKKTWVLKVEDRCFCLHLQFSKHLLSGNVTLEVTKNYCLFFTVKFFFVPKILLQSISALRLPTNLLCELKDTIKPAFLCLSRFKSSIQKCFEVYLLGQDLQNLLY